MFKQRKAKGSLKQKKVVADEDSDSEAEPEGATGAGVTKEKKSEKTSSSSSTSLDAVGHRAHKSSKTTKKKPGPSMSFLDDENSEENVTTFKVKKSKLRTIDLQ